MSFRGRLTLVSGAAVALAVAVASGGVYVAAQGVLRSQVDETLRSRASLIGQVPSPIGVRLIEELAVTLTDEPFGGPRTYVQVVSADGRATRPRGSAVGLPVSDRARQVAAGHADAYLADFDTAGTHVRVLTAPYVPGLAVQLARPLDEVDRTLRRLAFILVAFTLGGLVLGAGLGRVVAQAALRPVRRLSEATEHVARTHDLSRRIEAQGRDELAQLAGNFNRMLAALDRSLGAQRQLVADASHELRTPLTSVRTNIEVLAGAKRLPPGERERLLADVVDQLEELTALVTDIVELARGDAPELTLAEVRLDEIVGEAIERARRHSPGIEFRAELEPTVVRGAPDRLARAVGNLLDNASKWSPANGTVDVCVRDGEVTVRDYGPGIAESDLPTSSTVSTALPPLAGSPDPASGSRSCERLSRRMAAESARSGRQAAARCCGFDS